MKKTYQTPTMDLQNFVPNEHVAACYLVHCPVHLNPQNYNDYSHAGKNQWFEKSASELLAGGITQSQLDHIDSLPADTAVGSHSLTAALGNDGVMSHSDVQLKTDRNGTNFGS